MGGTFEMVVVVVFVSGWCDGGGVIEMVEYLLGGGN